MMSPLVHAWMPFMHEALNVSLTAARRQLNQLYNRFGLHLWRPVDETGHRCLCSTSALLTESSTGWSSPWQPLPCARRRHWMTIVSASLTLPRPDVIDSGGRVTDRFHPRIAKRLVAGRSRWQQRRFRLQRRPCSVALCGSPETVGTTSLTDRYRLRLFVQDLWPRNPVPVRLDVNHALTAGRT
jgi:hypothetical protein